MSTAMPKLTITVTDTIVSTYEVSEDDLRSLALPFDAAELENRDGDYIATSLAEVFPVHSVSVVERQLEFSITP